MTCQRTCVVCRKTESKSFLLRFVNETSDKSGESSKLVFDARMNKDGRGAYCHLDCLGSDTIRSLERSFKRDSASRKGNKFSLVDLLEEGLEEVRCKSQRNQLKEKILSLKVNSDAQRASRRNIRL